MQQFLRFPASGKMECVAYYRFIIIIVSSEGELTFIGYSFDSYGNPDAISHCVIDRYLMFNDVQLGIWAIPGIWRKPSVIITGSANSDKKHHNSYYQDQKKPDEY